MKTLTFTRRTSLAVFFGVFEFGICCACAATKEPSASATQDLPSFKEGKGLSLPEETRQAIGLTIVEVEERKLASHITTEVQVYRTANNAVRTASNAQTSMALAAGLLSAVDAKNLKVGMFVNLIEQRGAKEEPARGVLRRLDAQMAAATGQVEALVEISDPNAKYPIGAFLTAYFTVGKEETVTTVPSEAVLNAAEGTFVYVVNGEHFFRTAVTVGREGDGFVEIKDGLYAGDKVVVKPVQTLWLAELRFVKGGAACAGD